MSGPKVEPQQAEGDGEEKSSLINLQCGEETIKERSDFILSPNTLVKEVLPLHRSLLQLREGGHGAVVREVIKGVALPVVDVGHDLKCGV